MLPPIRFYKGSALDSGRLGVFPGAFNPVTRAHLAVAAAAQRQYQLDQIVFLLPRTLPHKQYTGASLEQRVELLASAFDDDRFGIASSEGGLFVEIAREFRATCGCETAIWMICGRDAAERIVHWDYGFLAPFHDQLNEFELLVASRGGEYASPAELSTRIHAIEMPVTYNEVSSSAVREAIASGRDWESLVPDPVAREIRRTGLYK